MGSDQTEEMVSFHLQDGGTQTSSDAHDDVLYRQRLDRVCFGEELLDGLERHSLSIDHRNANDDDYMCVLSVFQFCPS